MLDWRSSGGLDLLSHRANQKPALALIAGELLDPEGRRAVAEAIAERDEEAAELRAREALCGSLEVALDLLSRSK